MTEEIAKIRPIMIHPGIHSGEPCIDRIPVAGILELWDEGGTKLLAKAYPDVSSGEVAMCLRFRELLKK